MISWNVDEWGLVVQVILTVLAFAAVLVSVVSTRKTLEIARSAGAAQTILQIDDRLKEYETVHANLRPKGAWAADPNYQFTAVDWVQIEQYMGIFERIESFTQLEILQIKVVKNLYGYRYRNLVADSRIRQQKLETAGRSWARFIELGKRLEK